MFHTGVCTMENKRRKKNNGLQDATHEPACDS